jgi:hypothetical protein
VRLRARECPSQRRDIPAGLRSPSTSAGRSRLGLVFLHVGTYPTLALTRTEALVLTLHFMDRIVSKIATLEIHATTETCGH